MRGLPRLFPSRVGLAALLGALLLGVAAWVMAAEPKQGGTQLMRATAQLVVVNNKTLRLDLKEPFALVLDALAKPSNNVPFIMPARLARAPADEQITAVIGSGPFKFVQEEWQPGHRVVYVRNPDKACCLFPLPSSGTCGWINNDGYAEAIHTPFSPGAGERAASETQNAPLGPRREPRC